MNGESISSAVSASAKALYSYLEDMQWVTDPPKGVSEIRVESSEVHDDYAILHIPSLLPDTAGLMLRIGRRILSEEQSDFSRYDEITKTILVRPGIEALEEMTDPGTEISILTDMKFLIASAGDFYRRYGKLIGMPHSVRSDIDASYPDMGVPSREQEIAAEGMLKAKAAYVWGAPGTGKTQFVLASAIRGCLAAGESIAVFAPTNNSVEQVLQGILSVIPPDERGDVIRLGIPSKRFNREHPEMCEDRQVQRLLDRTMESLENIEEAIYERMADQIKGYLDDLKEAGIDSWSLLEAAEARPDLKARIDSIVAVCRMRRKTADILEDGDMTAEEQLKAIEDCIFERRRPAAQIREYSEMTLGDMMSLSTQLEEEADALRTSTSSCRIAKARIIAATPQQFISRFRPKGSEDDGRIELDVDRIFLDEAGYCGLVQALALFSNGVPVVMLGDHMQLPPVSELDEDDLRRWAREGGRMDDAFIWSLPALECERMLTSGIDESRRAFLNGEEPLFESTVRFDLTRTRRFGSNLAEVLDRHVYRNGLTGVPGSHLEMICIDAVCERRKARENSAEAGAVSDYLKAESPDPKEVCVLSPYSVQCSLLKSCVPRRYRDSVMTIHGSQGREWDTVVISIADCRLLTRDVPLRFSSSFTSIGLKVINTAVSRAKKRLVIVCDREFWLQRTGELIKSLIEVSEGGSAPLRGFHSRSKPRASTMSLSVSLTSCRSVLTSESWARSARLSASRASMRSVDAEPAFSAFMSLADWTRASLLERREECIILSFWSVSSSPSISARTILISRAISSSVMSSISEEMSVSVTFFVSGSGFSDTMAFANASASSGEWTSNPLALWTVAFMLLPISGRSIPASTNDFSISARLASRERISSCMAMALAALSEASAGSAGIVSESI